MQSSKRKNGRKDFAADRDSVNTFNKDNIMKKLRMLCLTVVLLAVSGALAFGDGGEQELDFLLFLPDSSDRFADEDLERIHLDNAARYLLSRNLYPGQIHVHGYAARAKNDIEPMDLSRDRALFVMAELQKRGVPAHLFSEPAAHGEADLWGSNETEEARNPNRRVRILVDSYYLSSAAFLAAEETRWPGTAANESRAGFPRSFLIPLLAILAALILFALELRKKPSGEPAHEAPHPNASDSELIAAGMAANDCLVNLEEEIRRRAYELYLERNGQDGDADGDWYKAVPEVCAHYEADVYQVYNAEDGCWWAHRYI